MANRKTEGGQELSSSETQPQEKGMNLKEIAERIFKLLPMVSEFHSPDSELYIVLDKLLRASFSNSKEVFNIFPFDGMVWPQIDLGKVKSHDDFILHQILPLSFCWVNRDIYKTAFDVGANLGMDSLVLSRFGYEVHAFEPDPWVCEMLTRNVALNKGKVHIYQKAFYDASGMVDFVRVRGNLTASHVSGARGFHGETDHFKVEAVTFRDLNIKPDFMKINAEGCEGGIVSSIDSWEEMDAIIEVHNEKNAKSIFDCFLGSNINIFSQKLGWQKAKKIEEMPTSYKEGHIFVSKKQEMPWQRSAK